MRTAPSGAFCFSPSPSFYRMHEWIYDFMTFSAFFFTNSKFRSIFDAFNIIYCFIFRSVIIQIESRYIYLYSVLRISRFKSIPKKIRRQSGKNSIGKIFSEFSAVATERDFGCAQRASRRSMHVAWKHAEYLKIHIRFIILGKL